MITTFNTYTGELYKIQEQDLKNLQEGEIPLSKSPQQNCKKCYGRGHIGYVSEKYYYKPCTHCIEKRILPEHTEQILFNYISFKKTAHK